MARSESSREDLFSEAKAFVWRLELQIHGDPRMVVVGFRESGAASFFWDASLAWQFNAAGALRRGYADGLLYKAEGGNLVSLERRRDASATTLTRMEMTPSEQSRLVEAVRGRLIALRTALREGRCNVLREHPADGTPARRLAAWLSALPSRLEVASSPRVE